MVPSPADFAALARSSPWLWSTLRLTYAGLGSRTRERGVRAWLRRPNVLRVETMAGELVQVVHEPAKSVALLTWDGAGGQQNVTEQLSRPNDPGVPQPILRDDGLVAERPGGWSARLDYDAPMFQNYYWVALLDPVELADGTDRTGDGPGGTVPGTTIDDVAVVDHHGREAWQALVRPRGAYEPRCGCCQLLPSRESDLLEWGENRPEALLAHYPDAYRVRLDRGTGVCVRIEAIGGDTAGDGHEVVIEAVDEEMGDALFPEQRPTWRQRTRLRRA